MRTRALSLALFLTAAASCSVAHPGRGGECSGGSIVRVYFGADTPNGTVSPEAWSEFVDRHISPAFPAGFTVLEATGQWRNPAGSTVRESSRILEVLEHGTGDGGVAVRKIAEEYAARFKQDAVLVVTAPADACFFTAGHSSAP